MVMNLYFAICATFLLSGAVKPFHHGNKIKRRSNEMRIVGGNVSAIENMPYMVSLHDSGVYFCGGSILNTCYVLTSAGCVYRKEVEALTVRAGSPYNNQSGTEYAVKYFFIHPKFSVEKLDYNVALVMTKKPIIFGPMVKPISLGTTEPLIGEFLIVAGWGELEVSATLGKVLQNIKEGGEHQFELHFTRVQMGNKKKCAIIYENFFDLTDRMICTYREGKGTCHGDNGGPVIYNNRIVGVVSHRIGCGMHSAPDLHTNTADPDIRKFIMSGIRSKCM